MLSRRRFMQLVALSFTGLNFIEQLLPLVDKTLAQGRVKKPTVIWIEAGTCTGDSISLDNAVHPNMKKLLSDIINLKYSWLFAAAQGDRAHEELQKVLKEEEGEFILVVEGSVIQANNGKYNYIWMKDNQPITGLEAVKDLAAKAKYVVTVGSCASFGGPARMSPNPAKSVGVWEVVDKLVINVPGCPAHPDWMIGTIVHLSLYGVPELDSLNRPKMFFGELIHDKCQRRQAFEDGIFASYPGEEGCYFKVGCKGPVTYSDCPKRMWQDNSEWPVISGSPCIGCTEPGFPDAMSPFYERLPHISALGRKVTANTLGLSLAGLAGLGITGHLVTSIYKGRVQKKLVEGTKEQSEDQGKSKLEEIKERLAEKKRKSVNRRKNKW